VAWHHDGAAKGRQTHRVRQLLGGGRHRRATVVPVPPGVPAGAGAVVATPAHREDRTRPTAGRADRPPGMRTGGCTSSGTPPTSGNACATCTTGSAGPAG
jgi:hypothetical protein